MQPVLKAHGTQRSKLKYKEPLSSIALKFNLRRHIKLRDRAVHVYSVGAYTRSR